MEKFTIIGCDITKFSLAAGEVQVVLRANLKSAHCKALARYTIKPDGFSDTGDGFYVVFRDFKNEYWLYLQALGKLFNQMNELKTEDDDVDYSKHQLRTIGHYGTLYIEQDGGLVGDGLNHAARILDQTKSTVPFISEFFFNELKMCNPEYRTSSREFIVIMDKHGWTQNVTPMYDPGLHSSIDDTLKFNRYFVLKQKTLTFDRRNKTIEQLDRDFREELYNYMGSLWLMKKERDLFARQFKEYVMFFESKFTEDDFTRTLMHSCYNVGRSLRYVDLGISRYLETAPGEKEASDIPFRVSMLKPKAGNPENDHVIVNLESAVQAIRDYRKRKGGGTEGITNNVKFHFHDSDLDGSCLKIGDIIFVVHYSRSKKFPESIYDYYTFDDNPVAFCFWHLHFSDELFFGDTDRSFTWTQVEVMLKNYKEGNLKAFE